jgi:hypothetical protein
MLNVKNEWQNLFFFPSKIHMPQHSEETNYHISMDLSEIRRSANPYIFPIIEQVYTMYQNNGTQAKRKTIYMITWKLHVYIINLVNMWISFWHSFFFQLFFLSEKAHLKAHIKAVKIHPFIKLCLKCAWISSVQDRPLSVTFGVRPRSPFYPDVMIPCNAPAPNVDYLVWPIVFLYDKGPLLVKGIVYCSQSK